MDAKELLNKAIDYVSAKAADYHEAKATAIFADEHERCEMMALELEGMESLLSYLQDCVSSTVDLSGIELEDIWNNEECDEITYYFTGPKELIEEIFPGVYTNVYATEISLSFPKGMIEPSYGNVEISPVEFNGEGYSDYDWNEIAIPYEDIEKLLEIAEKDRKGF